MLLIHGIYLLLLLLFDSTTQPILVMIAIPFGLVGVILAFALHQQTFSFLTMLGIVGLTGIMVNDSLILVNLVNRLLDTHPELTAHERIINSSKTRLRPIVLTSITTVAGLLPMAWVVRIRSRRRWHWRWVMAFCSRRRSP